MAIHSPHDLLFHATFRTPRHVVSWLRCVLPTEVFDAFDWSTLAPAPARVVALAMRVHVADLVFTVELLGSGERVLVILEHKAWHDTMLDSQVTRYVVHLRRMARRDGEPEPLVLPVVLHHGDEPFSAAGVARPTAPPALLAWQPRVTFVVDDLFGRDEAALRRPQLTALAQLTHLALARVRHFTDAETLLAIDRWGDLLRAVEADEEALCAEEAIQAFGRYLLETTNLAPEDLHMAFAKNLQHGNPIMTTAQRLRQEGHHQGLHQGLQQGLHQGLHQGLQQGLSEGHNQGQAQTLLRLLARRFGPLAETVVQRVHSGTSAELDRWTDRLLDAASVDDLFATGPATGRS